MLSTVCSYNKNSVYGPIILKKLVEKVKPNSKDMRKTYVEGTFGTPSRENPERTVISFVEMRLP